MRGSRTTPTAKLADADTSTFRSERPTSRWRLVVVLSTVALLATAVLVALGGLEVPGGSPDGSSESDPPAASGADEVPGAEATTGADEVSGADEQAPSVVVGPATRPGPNDGLGELSRTEPAPPFYPEEEQRLADATDPRAPSEGELDAAVADHLAGRTAEEESLAEQLGGAEPATSEDGVQAGLHADAAALTARLDALGQDLEADLENAGP